MRKPKTPTLVTTAILTLITVFFWAGFEVYRSLTIKPAPPVPEKILQPLDPNLDTKSLDEIQNRTFLTDDQIGTISVSPVASASSTPSPIPVSSPSATPTSEPTTVASPSAVPTP